MTREDFVEGYMSRSKKMPYTLDGESVVYEMNYGAGPWVQYALECACGEDGCEGWAMVPAVGRGWHEFQNGRMTYEEGCAVDDAAMEVEKPGWLADWRSKNQEQGK